MRTRKALQNLQASATDEAVLVGSPKMPHKTELDNLESVKVEKKGKRQTKRKNAGVENKLAKPSKEEPKEIVSVKSPKLKSDNAHEMSKMEETILMNQSRLETYFTPCTPKPSSSQIFDTSTLSQSVLKEIALITSDTPTQLYWEELSEQRRIAIDKTLLENELLTDQVNVLQTENKLLKSALEAAEKLLKMEGLLDS